MILCVYFIIIDEIWINIINNIEIDDFFMFEN